MTANQSKSSSAPPLTLIALLLIWLVLKIVTISWNEYAHPEQMIILRGYAVALHIVTGLIFAAAPLITLFGKAG